MSDLQSRRWRPYFVLLLLAALLSAAPVAPAVAAEVDPVMPNDGIPPSWYRSLSTAELACENNRPECRAAVREKLATERAITRTLPWIVLCIVLWIMVRFARRRDKQREQRRQEAARHHVRASVREKQQRPAQTTNDDDDSLDDGLGVGTPGGKRGGLR